MKTEKVPFMLSIPKEYRDQLRRMAAENNFKNPDTQTFAATIATKVLCEYLEQLGAEK
jgi:hypothetical protein